MKAGRVGVVLALGLLFWGCRTLPLDRSDSLRSGPMLGYATQTEVLIWLQTRRPASVQVRYWPEAKPGWARTTGPVRTDPQGDHIARIAVGDLAPGERYQYQVRLNGSLVERPYPLYFKTRVLWEWRGDPPDFSVATGSCAYINQDPYDRPGEPYGGDYRIFRSILRERPDLMLWLGDNTYLREVDWGSPQGIAGRYAHTRSTEELQPLLANTSHYAIWDDHDYGPDNADRSFVLKGASQSAFQRYWGNPSYGLPELPGIFGSFSWGDVDFFLLDDRSYRSPSNAPAGEDKQMLGPGQIDWLIDALTASRATFKLVANGSQILNSFPGHENYSRFPEEREQLLAALDNRAIEGVIFLSGDRHFTELARVDRPGLYPLYELTSSPLTAGVSGPRGEEANNPLRVEGTLLRERNFVVMTFSGPLTDRVLTFKAVNSDGEARWEHHVRAAELRIGRTGEGPTGGTGP